MVQLIKPANIFGRIGSGFGQGLSEQLPKEVERSRLGSSLEQLGNRKDLTPFQQFAGLVSAPGSTNQIVESGSNLLRQQAIIDSIGKQQSGNNPASQQGMMQQEQQNQGQKSSIPLSSATTPQSTKSALQPYIPPSGREIEALARQKMSQEPLIYPNIEAARAAVNSEISGDTNKSNAQLNKRSLEKDVQNNAEENLKAEIKTLGADIPGTALSKLQQKAVDDVASGKLSPDQAKVKYGQEADAMSRNFSNINSWGDFGLLTKKPKELFQSIRSVQKDAKKGGYQKEAADSMIERNGLTPRMAYAQMYPVHDLKGLNHAINELPDIKPRAEKVVGAGPGIAGIGMRGVRGEDVVKKTLEACPRLAGLMGTEGSPLSVSYELDQKGYDPNIWIKYLLDNEENLNLSRHQTDELGKPQPGYFGQLNDWWLKNFSGVE